MLVLSPPPAVTAPSPTVDITLATVATEVVVGLSSDVTAAARGDREAFARLYRAHVNRVFTLCARILADDRAAEETTQDVFVRVWEKLPGFRGESAFTTWLHRIAVNVALTRRKAGAVRADRETLEGDFDDVIAPHAPSVGDRIDLEAAIARLPLGARRIFVLHDVEGFTHEEIGAELGITSGGSKAQLHRARHLLRAMLDR
jgi:RNA polymerase sigma-70 factor (ECF subfamily)